MRVEISSRLWVVNLTGIPLEFGASNGSSRLGTVPCALLPPTNELPDTCARVVNVSDDVVGLRLKCAAGGAGGMPCAWSDEEIPIDRPGMSIDVSTRASGRPVRITCTVDNGPLAFGLGRLTVVTCMSRHALRVSQVVVDDEDEPLLLLSI